VRASSVCAERLQVGPSAVTCGESDSACAFTTSEAVMDGCGVRRKGTPRSPPG
jgi:hypothetical protein